MSLLVETPGGGGGGAASGVPTRTCRCASSCCAVFAPCGAAEMGLQRILGGEIDPWEGKREAHCCPGKQDAGGRIGDARTLSVSRRHSTSFPSGCSRTSSWIGSDLQGQFQGCASYQCKPLWLLHFTLHYRMNKRLCCCGLTHRGGRDDSRYGRDVHVAETLPHLDGFGGLVRSEASRLDRRWWAVGRTVKYCLLFCLRWLLATDQMAVVLPPDVLPRPAVCRLVRFCVIPGSSSGL